MRAQSTRRSRQLIARSVGQSCDMKGSRRPVSGLLLAMGLLSACSTASTSTPNPSGQAGDVAASNELSKRRAKDFTWKFLDWWQFHQDRAKEVAPDLPTTKLFPGLFRVSWAMPTREGDGWRVRALAVKSGPTLALRELSLLLSKSSEGDLRVEALAEEPEVARGLREIVEILDRYLEVPIVLPSVPRARFDPMRSRIHLGPPAPQGYLAWRWKDGRRLIATYGTASIFTCGGGSPTQVKIGEESGLARTEERRATVVWPAAARFPRPSYGLSGSWPLDRLLSWATQMQENLTDELDEAPLSSC